MSIKRCSELTCILSLRTFSVLKEAETEDDEETNIGEDSCERDESEKTSELSCFPCTHTS